jgi:hypothetical protein
MEFAKTTGIPQYIRVSKQKVNGKDVILGLRINDIIRCEVRSIAIHYAITTIGKASFGVVVLDMLDDGENKLFAIKTDPKTGKNYVDPVTHNNLQYGRAIYKVRNVIYRPSNWIWRINEADWLNLVASSKYQLYGIRSVDNHVQHFMKYVKKGDCIWLIRPDGKLMAVVSFVSMNNRSPGELIDTTLTIEELGWANSDDCDNEVHYHNLYDMQLRDIYMQFHNGLEVFTHNNTTDEPGKQINEYVYINKYMQPADELVALEQSEHMIHL